MVIVGGILAYLIIKTRRARRGGGGGRDEVLSIRGKGESLRERFSFPTLYKERGPQIKSAYFNRHCASLCIIVIVFFNFFGWGSVCVCVCVFKNQKDRLLCRKFAHLENFAHF